MGATPVTPGIWHHVAATYDGVTWRLYLDGNLDATDAPGNAPRDDSIQPFGIGTSFDSFGVPVGAFDGRIQDVRVWDHARTGSEIESTMYQRVTSAPGLIASFPLDEGSGATAMDQVSAAGLPIVGASWQPSVNRCGVTTACWDTVFWEGDQGYAGSRDTYLQAGMSSNDDVVELLWDGDSGDPPPTAVLLRFEDLFESEGGRIPDASTIDAAFVTYGLSADVNAPGDEGSVHEILVDGSETVDWSSFGPEAGIQSGTDYDPAEVTAASGNDPDPDRRTLHDIDVTSSLQAWSQDPASNRGWIIVAKANNGARISSSEAVSPGDRPRLRVRLVPEPSAVTMLIAGSVALIALARWRGRG